MRTCTIPSPQALAKALKTNRTVTSIQLYGNQIGHEGAKARSATKCSEVKFPPSLRRAKPKAWSGDHKPSPAHFFFPQLPFRHVRRHREGFGLRLQSLGFRVCRFTALDRIIVRCGLLQTRSTVVHGNTPAYFAGPPRPTRPTYSIRLESVGRS